MLLLQKLRPKVKYGTLQCSRKTVYSDRKNNNSKKQQQKNYILCWTLNILFVCIFYNFYNIHLLFSFFFFLAGETLDKGNLYYTVKFKVYTVESKYHITKVHHYNENIALLLFWSF